MGQWRLPPGLHLERRVARGKPVVVPSNLLKLPWEAVEKLRTMACMSWAAEYLQEGLAHLALPSLVTTMFRIFLGTTWCNSRVFTLVTWLRLVPLPVVVTVRVAVRLLVRFMSKVILKVLTNLGPMLLQHSLTLNARERGCRTLARSTLPALALITRHMQLWVARLIRQMMQCPSSVFVLTLTTIRPLPIIRIRALAAAVLNNETHPATFATTQKTRANRKQKKLARVMREIR